MSSFNLLTPRTDNSAPYATGMAENGDLVLIDRGQAGLQDLPEDFFMSCITSDFVEGVNLTRFMYLTDTYRIFILEDLVPEIASNCASVFQRGNHVYFLYYTVAPSSSTPQQPFAVLHLEGGIINNVFTLINSNYQVLDGVIYEGLNPRVHCEGYHDGWLYFATRVNDNAIATQFIKVNAFNVNEYEIYSPFNGGGLTNIQIYKNYIYCLPVFDAIGSAFITRINTNFKEPAEQIVEVGTDISRQIRRQFPFTIYLDEIYIFTTDGNIANPEYNTSLGVEVYSMSGELKRSVYDLPVAPLSTSPIVPHWMDIFNGQMIFHTYTTSTVSADGRKIARIDAYDLTLEETVTIPDFVGGLSDDNTVRRNGEVYLSAESASGLENRKLFKCDSYLNLSAVYNETPNIDDLRTQTVGYTSGGTTPTYVPKESLQIPVQGGNANIEEYASVDVFPVTGEANTIYLSQEQGRGYWWNGSTYLGLWSDIEFPKIIHNNVTEVAVTGTITPTVVNAKLIPADTLGEGTLQSDVQFTHTGSAGGFAIVQYLNDTPDTAGTPLQIGVYVGGSANMFGQYGRRYVLQGTNIKGFVFGTSSLRDNTISNSAMSVGTYNRSLDKYLVTVMYPLNSADTVNYINSEIIYKSVI